MKVTFLFKLGSSGAGGCPALYATDRGSYVVQGYRLDDHAAGQMRQVAANESGVEIPDELVGQIGQYWKQQRSLRARTARALARLRARA